MKKICVISIIGTLIGTIICIYKKEFYLAFRGFLILIFGCSMILEDNSINKNKIFTKISFACAAILISLSIFEMFGT